MLKHEFATAVFSKSRQRDEEQKQTENQKRVARPNRWDGDQHGNKCPDERAEGGNSVDSAGGYACAFGILHAQTNRKRRDRAEQSHRRAEQNPYSRERTKQDCHVESFK